jgi:hypothetical protein
MGLYGGYAKHSLTQTANGGKQTTEQKTENVVVAENFLSEMRLINFGERIERLSKDAMINNTLTVEEYRARLLEILQEVEDK